MKDLNQVGQETKRNIVQDFEVQLPKMSVKGLQLTQTKLNYLCLHFDPYDPTNLNQELENIINEYNLNDFVSNPFVFTNIVLQLLDKLEQEIKLKEN